jgi:hypothetical protein
MIILDLQQSLYASIYSGIKEFNETPNENQIRHLILMTILKVRRTLTREYGSLVIACDGRNYWRKEVFPYYKFSRKKDREKSLLNWDAISESFFKIKNELVDDLPYPAVLVDRAEADDVIGTLVPHLNDGNTIILSGDHDFLQLHRPGVVQHNWVMNKKVSVTDPEQYLKEKILKGDDGDGVPNVLSAGSCFAEGVRQSPMTKKRLSYLLETPYDAWEPNVQANYDRNKTLIDLKMTPEDVRSKIIQRYEDQIVKPRPNITNYLMRHRLRALMEHSDSF